MYYHVMSVLSWSNFSTFSDDRLDQDLTVSTVSAATCLDHGLELAGNSLSVGTNVESWSAL